ncbi:MAG: CcoQ/FixQ family Cbb3-type cytochrome c oxidase assembly chaperone [Sphingobacteriales bacterium JAD_PAG50586_3]|nr:MAG: CcoQ/FixQ family Cbb3-type cytochrome c oxidase assembly chaperone [Sphingobacteriales bacterium JAD_PAG50586_3]
MFKFIKQYAETIVGIEVYPLVSMMIFILFFLGVTAYVFFLRKGYIHEMEELPLEKDGITPENLN